VLGTLRPLIKRRSPIVLQRIEDALGELAGAVKAVEGPGGSMPRWDTLPAPERTEVSGAAAGAAEALAYVPEIVDPRPALPVKSSLGTEESG